MRSGGRRRKRLGLSLVETALVVSLVGTLLAVFVPTFVRELRISKASEASENLAYLHASTATYFAARHDDGVVERAWCLPEVAGPTPRHPSAHAIEFDFFATTVDGHETWQTLDFRPLRVRYRYTFLPEASGCGIRRTPGSVAVTLRAEGDLDQDGDRSLFERSASIDTEGHLIPLGGLRTLHPIE